MNRRIFIKNSFALGLGVLTNRGSRQSKDRVSEAELIGKAKPKLFGEGYLLRHEAHRAFSKMKEDASKSGIVLSSVSSYRSFDKQRAIWNRKYTLFTKQGMTPEDSIEKIMKYSTVPGTSRHHWGTEVDLIDGRFKKPVDPLMPQHFARGGVYFELKEWMSEFAEAYGFFLTYTDDNSRNGFAYEPWHYSYKPLSQNYLKAFCKLDLFEVLQQESIVGKKYFTRDFLRHYLDNYVLGVNPLLVWQTI